MKNLLKSALVFFVIMSLFQSCSEDEETPVNTQFTIDGQTYNLLPTNGVVELKMNNLININGQYYDRSSITISGTSGTLLANLNFDLFYKDGLPVAGTYTIADTLDGNGDFYSDLSVAQKLCSGWTSMCVVVQSNSSSALIDSNNPTGTVKVINNGNNNYTVQFNGNYRKYNSNFDVIGTVPVVMDITTNVTVQ